MNTPQTKLVNVTVNGVTLAKMLNALSTLGLNFTQNQQLNEGAWRHLVEHEEILRQLTEVCEKVYKLQPPIVAFNALKQLVAQVRTLPNATLGALMCFGMMSAISRALIDCTMAMEKKIAETQQKPSTESAPVKLH